MPGWGDFFGGLMDKLPIPGRVEGIRNEIDKLEKEKNAILKNGATEKMANRLDFIQHRISYLNKRMLNIAK